MNLKRISLLLLSISTVPYVSFGSNGIEIINQLNQDISKIRNDQKAPFPQAFKAINNLLVGKTSYISPNKFAGEAERLCAFESFFHGHQSRYNFSIGISSYATTHEIKHLVVLDLMRQVAHEMCNLNTLTNYEAVIEHARRICVTPTFHLKSGLTSIYKLYNTPQALQTLFPQGMVTKFLRSFDFKDVSDETKQIIEKNYNFTDWTFPPSKSYAEIKKEEEARQQREFIKTFTSQATDLQRKAQAEKKKEEELVKQRRIEKANKKILKAQASRERDLRRHQEEQESLLLIAKILQEERRENSFHPFLATQPSQDDYQQQSDHDHQLALILQEELNRSILPIRSNVKGERGVSLYNMYASPIERADREKYAEMLAAYKRIAYDADVHTMTASFGRPFYHTIKQLEQKYLNITNDNNLLTFDQLNNKLQVFLNSDAGHSLVPRQAAINTAMNKIQAYYNAPVDGETGVDLRELFSHIWEIAESQGRTYLVCDKLAENIETAGGCHPGVSGRFIALYFVFLGIIFQ